VSGKVEVPPQRGSFVSSVSAFVADAQEEDEDGDGCCYAAYQSGFVYR